MRAGGWLERRRTERTAAEAKAEHQELADAYKAVRDQHAPVIDRHQQLANQLERHRTDRGETHADQHAPDPAAIERKLEALGTWHDWATGQPVTQPDLVVSVTVLRDTAVDRGQFWEIREQYGELAETLTDWAREPAHRVRLPEPPRIQIERPGMDLGLDIGF